ncbi:MAG: nucleotide exchange factor GrpE [Vulcanimicrobiaceae bacterium]
MTEEQLQQNETGSESDGEARATGTIDLQAQLDAANARAEDNYNKFLLAMADFENYKKRIERKLSEQVVSHYKKLLVQFLPVIDNLERALGYEGESNDGLRGGVQQTLRGFEAVLANEGVRSFSVKGQPFDPNIAEAIGTQKADGIEDDVVLEEVQKGYKLGDDLLRPAKVIVAKNGD